MIWSALRWLGRNLGAFLLSFALALMVWVSAVLNADPNVACASPSQIPLDVIGQDTNLLLFGDIPENIRVTLRAPQSICARMSSDPGAVLASIDLSTLEEGEHTVPVNVLISERYRPVRLLDVSPEVINVQLESFDTRVLPLRPIIKGTPAPGYTPGFLIISTGDENVSPSRVTISGRKSLVDQVVEAVVSLDITDADADVIQTRSIQLVDQDGNPVVGLTVEPAQVTVRQVIERPSTYRDVTVKVVTIGQPAEGYRLTNISSSPQVVTVFSSDPELVREMPGFLETTPVDLTGATDDIERRVFLILPEGVSIAGEQTVLVQVGIAAIESSQTIAVEVEAIGLAQGLEAAIAPATVDVIISGPLSVLESLQPGDVRVVIDLTGLEPGLYTLEPLVEILPPELRADSVLPGTIEVTITLPPTPTPTPTTNPLATPTLTPFPTPSPTPTP